MPTNLRPFWLRLCLGLAALASLSVSATAAPVTTHPRLLFHASDLQTLRDRMIDSNDAWVAFRDEVVTKALRDWRSSSTRALRPHNNWTPNDPSDDYLAPTRVTFTDDKGVLHKEGDADWTTTPPGASEGSWGNETEHPAAPEDDTGAHTGNQPLISEQYAMLFAFMALMTKDDPAQQKQHDEFVTAAKQCLFTVIDPASLGHPAPDADGKYPPFRHPSFALQDRSFAQEAFGLTVDWIYDEFTAEERAKIRKTFLLWAADTWTKPYYSPINPNNLVNDPAILGLDSAEQALKRSNLRIALNNHYANHLRQLTLYALAFDPADDVPSSFASVADNAPAGALTSYAAGPGGASDWVYQNSGLLKNVTGSWLYLTDYAQRHDGGGGLSLEGTQYTTNGLGPLALAMTALHSAGEDDVARFGPQVSLEKHPFWSRMLKGYLALLAPAPRVNSSLAYLGSHFQPALTGDLENYAMLNDQFIKVLAPLAIHDWQKNGTTGEIVQAVRYIQRHLAPGGTSRLTDRIRGTRSEHRYRDALYYFLLFDPAAPAPADPRPALQENTFWAAYDPAGTMGQALARSGPTAQDTYFQWQLGWMRIDHQRGDNLGFGLWKNGLWLTKIMTGYGVLQGCSDYRNAPALQNTPAAAGGDSGNTQLQIDHGSQLIYESLGDPHLIARSTATKFLHFDGDATNLYNSYNRPEVRAVTHASRSLVWLKPDIVVVYDRSESQAGLWKRFYLNLPETPTIAGNVATATAREGQTAKAKLFVSSLLPAGAPLAATDISSGQPAPNEDMQARLVIAAPGAPAAARFLEVIEGADAAAAAPTATQLIGSTSGADYDGAVIGPRVVLFKRNATAPVASLAYQVPASVTEHYITGLAPFTAYTATFGVAADGDTTVALAPGGSLRFTDGGGVLLLGVDEPANVEIKASASTVVEGAAAPVTFTVSRSGDASTALTVPLALSPTSGTATATDISGLPASVTIPAGAASASFTVSALADGVSEGPEDLVVAVQPSAAFHIAEAGASATLTIAETAPNPGTLQFTAGAVTAAETAGNVTLTVTRLGSTEGDLSVSYAVTGGTATAGADYTTIGGTLAWADGESAPKTISLPLLDDADPETAETVVVKLLTPSQPGALGNPATATVTIADDESGAGMGGGNDNGGGNNGGGAPAIPGEGTLQFAAADYTVSEAAGTAQLHVSRTGSSVGVVSVNYYTLAYSAIGGTDYQAGGGTVTFQDGEIDKLISISVYDNATPQPSRYFKVALQSPGNGGVLGSLLESTVTLTDDDSGPPPVDEGNDGGGNNGGGGVVLPPAAPGSFEFAATAITVAENAGSATLTVNRVGGSDGAVSVNYYTLAGSALPGADYGYAGGTLHWAAGDASPKTIDVPIVNDTTEEPTKSFQLTLDSPAGGATLGAAALATITITDDEVVYHVGPGQPFTSLAQVPWSTLAPGNIVRIHWRAEAYKEKLLLSARGTAEQPIVVEGVAGPNGEQPVIDGTGAVAAANTGYAPWFGDVMERSIVAVARAAAQPAAYKPGHLVLSNLELTMSGAQNPMPSYTKPDGTSATYYSSAGAIFLYGAEHVTIRDCTIHDTPNGIVAASGSSETTLTRDLTVERCWLYHAGKGSSYNGANLLTEGIGLTVQFSRLDRGLNGGNTANVLDRSAGVVIRYNRIEGGANLLSLIEPVSAPALIVADPSFATTHVYGNILRNGGGDYGTDGSTLIRYGGDWSSAANFRSGTLHFHHNTVVVDSQRWSTTLFNLTLAPAQVVASNNVIHRAKSGAGPFSLVNSGRTIALGRNWITTGYSVGGTAANGTGLVLAGATPGFVSLATDDLHPAAGSPLLDAALALPDGALPVEWEYVPEADGQPRVTRGAASDLGALEKPQ
ncbi:MAG: hypothetical protein HYV96_07295 [Opitutae bacterium]|nr:hypothetical protein [Opitutae bacterium]